jgi:hypothetical protein
MKRAPTAEWITLSGNYRVLEVLLGQLASQVVIPKISVDYLASSGYCIVHDGTATKLRSKSWKVLGASSEKTRKDLSASRLARCVLVFPEASEICCGVAALTLNLRITRPILFQYRTPTYVRLSEVSRHS